MTPFRDDNIQKYDGSLFGPRTNPISGKRENHRGRDITTTGDWTVRECTGGTVIRVGYDDSRGKYIDVRTSPRHFERCQHMATIYLKKGDAAPQGIHLGVAGSTGASTGQHLHFGVYEAGPETDGYTSLKNINALEKLAVDPGPWLDIPNTKGTFKGNNNYDGDAAPAPAPSPALVTLKIGPVSSGDREQLEALAAQMGVPVAVVEGV